MHVHQAVSALPIIPFAGAGMVATAYGAHLLGLTAAVGWVVTLPLMLLVGWFCSLPVQFAYDRLIPARCPVCDSKAAYRRWPYIGRYRCRACGGDSRC